MFKYIFGQTTIRASVLDQVISDDSCDVAQLVERRAYNRKIT